MRNPITSTTIEASTSATANANAKRCKHHHHRHHHNHPGHQSLLPGLPDHIAQICLCHVRPSILYSVCKSWRRLIYSPVFPPFLSIYSLLLSRDLKSSFPNPVNFSLFDPLSNSWCSLPPPPADPPLRLLFRHPSYISRNLSIQTVSVSGKLVLLAATGDNFVPALSRPLVFNPLSGNWTYGPPLTAPRRWCAAGASGCAVYVASGIGSHYSTEVARSIEKWEIGYDCSNRGRAARNPERNWKWEKMGGLKDGRFSREAIEAIGWRNKLCMVNVKGDAAKDGIIYDIAKDSWQDMPEGMLVGWRGPAAAMDEETIYVVDESKGALRKYDSEQDIWVEIIEADMIKGAQQIAAGGGRVCVLCEDGLAMVVVDVLAQPPRLQVVETPVGYQSVAIHILPRMGQPDFQC